MDAFLIILILSIISYIIFYTYLKRIRNRNYRIFISIGLSCFIGIILYVFSVSLIIYALTKENHRQFERENWILVGEDMDKRLSRFEMIDDLIEIKILIKKDTLEIKQILGEPNWRDEEKNKWIYEAGTGASFGFIDHYLDIYYNESHKAVKLEHREIRD